MLCPNCNQQNPDGAKFCQSCGKPMDGLEMSWHKFMVNFALIASAIYNVYQGIVIMFGFGYGLDRAWVYSTYPGLQLVDILYGVALICFGGLCLYVRARLAKFKENGPMLVPLLYAFNIVAGILYLAAVGAVAGIDPINATTVASFAASILMAVINTTYYKKRKHLFVN